MNLQISFNSKINYPRQKYSKKYIYLKILILKISLLFKNVENWLIVRQGSKWSFSRHIRDDPFYFLCYEPVGQGYEEPVGNGQCKETRSKRATESKLFIPRPLPVHLIPTITTVKPTTTTRATPFSSRMTLEQYLCPSVDKIWHGETDIADWNAFGGNLDGLRDYDFMFDNDLSTYWVGYLPVTQRNKVVVTFKEPVVFQKLKIVTRPTSKKYFEGSYQSMCLVLDNDLDRKICTSADNDVGVGEVIELAPASATSVTQVELVIQKGAPGQIADFKIQYRGKNINSPCA